MRIIISLYVSLCNLLAAVTTTDGQVFPIQVSVSLLPPLGPHLMDITTPGARSLMIQIVVNDHTAIGYQSRLRIAIEGNGIAMRTRAGFPFSAIELNDPGIPLTLYGPDIEDYLRPEAMELEGISSSEMLRDFRLPEGHYRFTVEVVDFNRGTVVSNRGIASAWLTLHDPPLLNFPTNNARVDLRDPPNIAFSWTPRHGVLTNAGSNIEYTFRLTELWPENQNPYDAFQAQSVLYEETTNLTQLIYTSPAPALLPGRRYAWRVHARDTGGKSLFRNEGRSEVFVFQFGEALSIPRNLRMRWAKPTTLAIEWDPIPWSTDIRYRLQYRPRRRRENHEWYETWTRFTEKTLYHLDENTEYEMRVRSEDALQESEYSDIQVFRTLPPSREAFACGDRIEPPPMPENTSPVFPLAINDTIRAGGYNVIVRDVFKEGSRYHGSGYAIVPWLNQAKIKVNFEKIAVNHQFWLTSGTIRTIWDESSPFVIVNDQPPLVMTPPATGPPKIDLPAVDTLIVVNNAAIASVTRNENGDVEIITTDGKKHSVTGGISAGIVDDLGNAYLVDRDGKITTTTSDRAAEAAQRGSQTLPLHIRFARGGGKYGFDEKKHEALSHYYQRLGTEVFVSWKALPSSGSDLVEAVPENFDTDPHKVLFESGGVLIPASRGSSQSLQLTLKGTIPGGEDELFAYLASGDSASRQVVGRLNLATYDPAVKRLEVIPVNGARLPQGLGAESIQSHLDAIYSQAVVRWEVVLREALYADLEDLFDDGSSGLFSNYTADMKKVLKAFGELRNDTWYLFIIHRPRDANTLGYMPRNRRAGFVFTEPHGGNAPGFIKTIAHELGHGAFNLKHIFSDHAIPVGTSDNLMDYGEGTALNKFQWDRIHEPQGVLPLFDDGEDAANFKLPTVTFFEEATPFLQEAAYREWIEKVKRVYEFLQNCHGEGWESYNGQGIVPYCFWRDQNTPSALRYTVADLPFTAGLIDGGYAELEGMYRLPDVLRDAAKLPGKIVYAYTLAYWQCRDSELIASVEDYEYAVEQLAEIEREGGLWNWVREQWHDYKEQKESLEKYFRECRDAEDLREVIADLYELATQWDELTALSARAIESIRAYADTLKSESNQGRYELGSLVVPVGSLLMPLGTGVASKAEKLKDAFRKFGNLSTDNLRHVAREVVSTIWQKSGHKLTTGLRQVYDDCLRAGYEPSFGNAEIVFTLQGEAVAKISEDALHIKIPHGNGWARQSGSTAALQVHSMLQQNRKVYRLGRLNTSMTAEAQYWSAENPFDFPSIWDYAKKYGIPEENLMGENIFFEAGTLPDHLPYITREAPGVGSNAGGAIEVVVPPGTVKLETFSTVQFDK